MVRSFLSARSFFRDPVRYVRRHGRDEAALRLSAGPSRFLVVRDPQEIWRVLVTDADSYRPGKWKRRARRFVGDTLNTLDGEEHRRRRLLLQSALDRRRIAQFESSIEARVERAQAEWEDGERLRLRDELQRLSLGITGEVLFSAELEPDLAPELATVMASVPRLTPPLPGTRRARALREVEAAVSALIAERRRSPGPEDDLLAALLRGGLSDRTVHGEVIAFLLASVAEPPRALEAAWYLLGRHPSVEEHLLEDLDDGEHEYLDAVLRETLRLFPPTRHIDRRAVDSRTNVIVSPLVVHHDAALYESPSAFRPDRWLGQEERARGAYVPFGAGAHSCVGEPLARATMRTALRVIARRWRLRVDDGAPPPSLLGPRLVVSLERR